MKYSVILPTYNEALNIEELIKRIKDTIKDDYEIIVVDDNSPDGTWKVVEDISKSDPTVRCIRRMSDRGLTKSIADGIKNAKGEYVSWMDCDLSMPPEVLSDMINHLNEYDCVIASRFAKGGKNVGDSFLAELASIILSIVTRIVINCKVKDVTSGFIVIKRSIFDNYTLTGDYGEYFINLICELEKNKVKTIEIPFSPIPRERGESKSNPSLWIFFLRGLKYFYTIFKLRIKKTFK